MKIYKSNDGEFFYLIDEGKVWINSKPSFKGAFESQFTVDDLEAAMKTVLMGMYHEYEVTPWDLMKHDLKAVAAVAAIGIMVFVAIMAI